MPGARAAGVSRASLSYNIASYIHIRNDEIVAVARARATQECARERWMPQPELGIRVRERNRERVWIGLEIFK